MFDITRDDIAALNDEDLRTLIGLLCEAELRRANLPVSAVTYGGDQNAKDGGVDVRIALPTGTTIAGFIPRPATGFQVKKPDMPPSEIPREMKPKGFVRPVITQLAAESGAYIIVSSTGSTADSALNDRRAAMMEAVKDVPDAAKLHLDFYDRNRVASWVRDHAGLIPWVRSRIGKSVPGWQSYGAWSHVPAGADNSYLLDDEVRIKTGSKDDGDGLSVVDGLNRMRDALRQPGKVVRLVGLAGTGKTRLVEALFDSTIGASALDRSLAIYTDTADDPNPPPKGLASDLAAAGTRAILVVDNCPSETHKQLSETTRASGSTISAVTVEYDIGEDLPEGTDVFRLEPCSLALAEKLVRRRFPDLSQIDARKVAEFSGGNARIALALSSTVRQSETVSGLNDTELFTRLFQQRQYHDAGLLLIAQACSLVYSFQGEALSGKNAELPALGGLIGKNAQEVFAAAAELKRRDLLQQRREWRAVLPPAIANRLAAMALQNIPYSIIESAIVQGPSERLLRSLSRRLGYLHDSREAQAIVANWLASDGILSNVLELNELGLAIFENIAPVLPDATLSALENVFANADRKTLLRGKQFIRLLHSLAYEADLFERAVKLIHKFAEMLDDKAFDGEAVRAIASLFYIAFSGTHAPLVARLKVLNGFLASNVPFDQQLGAKALEAMLETVHFSPYGNFEFGARSRNYGYRPKERSEVGHWFNEVLKTAEIHALGKNPVHERVRRIIARQFRGLWRESGQIDSLELIFRAIAQDGFWRDGWVAVKQTRQDEGKRLSAESLRRLTDLEDFLRPKELVSSVRAVVLGANSGAPLDLDEFDEDESEVIFSERLARATIAIENLGRDVATDEKAFATLLPELISGSGKLGVFGRGLAFGAQDPRAMWNRLVAQVAATEKPNVQLLCGILNGLQERDGAIAQSLLDEAVEDVTVSKWFPTLQTSVTINETGVRRLHRALEIGRAPIGEFFMLVYGGVCEPISAPAFRDLVLAIDAAPDGNPIAIGILSMRLHSDGTAKREPLPETVEAGRMLLAHHRFERGNADHDYKLGAIVEKCLVGPDGVSVAQELWRGFKAAIERREIYAWDHESLLKALFKTQPLRMLDELAAGDDDDREKSIEIIRDTMSLRANPLSMIADEVVLGWCEVDPELRYPFAAAVVLLFSRPADNVPHEWCPIAGALLTRAPNPTAVLHAVGLRLWPMSFSGSVASKFESRIQLLDRLEIGTDPMLVAAFHGVRTKLAAQVEKERRRELEEDRTQSGRFE